MKCVKAARSAKLRSTLVAGLLVCGLGVIHAEQAPASSSSSDSIPDPDAKTFHDRYTADQLAALVPKARLEDVATPEALVKALNDSVSGPKEKWNSDRFRSLFFPGAILAYPYTDNGTNIIQHARLDDLVEALTKLHEKSSWYEKTLEVKIEKYNRIAFLHSRGTAGVDLKDPKEDGIEMGTMISDGNRWWIVSYIWTELPKKDWASNPKL
jgi:hypothetical protein